MKNPLTKLSFSINIISQFKENFWENDPGLLRLKRAFKTVLACLAAVFIMLPFHDPRAAMVAAFVASFSLQGIPGATMRQQMIAMLIIGTALVFSFSIASFAQPYAVAVSLLLITVSFLCFYLRKFGSVFNVFSISVWATCFMGTIMPNSSSVAGIVKHSLAAFMGFIVAFIINFALFPENKSASYFANLSTYFHHCATHLLWLANQINHTMEANTIKQEMLRQLADRRRLILMNQTILESFINPQKCLLKKLHKYYIAMHTIGKALSILNESCLQISKQKINVSPQVQQQLVLTLTYFANFLQTIEVDETMQIVQLKRKPEDCYRYLQDFKTTLFTYELNDTSSYLLTIHLGFQQLWRSLREI